MRVSGVLLKWESLGARVQDPKNKRRVKQEGTRMPKTQVPPGCLEHRAVNRAVMGVRAGRGDQVLSRGLGVRVRNL